MEKKKFQTKYGYFTEDGKEYVITNPATPRPWVNVICPKNYGLVVSQNGSGFSWINHVNFNRITRWQQDLIKDEWGKYVYIKDDGSKKFWSLTGHPANYECRHGIGYTRIKSKNFGIFGEMTVFVPPDENLEIWKIKLENNSTRTRRLSLYTYFEWCLGQEDSHREFHKLFIRTEYSRKDSILFASKSLKANDWNKNWEYFAFHSSSIKPASFEVDKEKFLGRYGSLNNPEILNRKKPGIKHKIAGNVDRWGDSIGSIHLKVNLKSREEKTIIFTLGVTKNKNAALRLTKKYSSSKNVEKSFLNTKKFWDEYLKGLIVETPDESFNFLTNVWLKYQAISSRLNGRTGYYQQSGAYGFRDQLQDSQIFLPVNPDLTKKQIFLHARHQFKDGSVYHWWHPPNREISKIRETEKTVNGKRTLISDDLLWLPYVVVNYLKETADFSALKEKIPFLSENRKTLNGPPATLRVAMRAGKRDTLLNHCHRAIDSVLGRFSKRGLPLIGEGDWNDGLSNVGRGGKGESIWLGHFLYGILKDWIEMVQVAGHRLQATGCKSKDLKLKIKKYQERARKLKKAINRYGWDGNWYIRATRDDGKSIGSRKCKEGKIFLNSQTWAIINGIVPESRKKMVLKSMERYLYRDYGPILFYPAYKKPDEKIGYLTRYAPGTRENGGVYTHAATWSLMSECVVKRQEKAWELYLKICPIREGLKPDLYRAEPYVTSGNVDGPDSPYFGQGGWTWYTGSAGWFFKIMNEWLLGIRPVYQGLLVDPCLPLHWKEFKMRRKFRGATYEITVKREPLSVNRAKKKTVNGKRLTVNELIVDGKKQKSNIIPPFGDGKIHKVLVYAKSQK